MWTSVSSVALALVALSSVAPLCEAFTGPTLLSVTGGRASNLGLTSARRPLLTRAASPITGLSMALSTKEKATASMLNPSAVFCPCGSGESYQDCCHVHHQNKKAPETPEELIKTRYSAFALGLTDYIIATTAKDRAEWSDNKAQWRREIDAFSSGYSFDYGVFIDQVKNFGPNVAYVRFKARMDQDGELAEFVENSRCEKKGKRWYYVKGNLMEHHGMMPIRETEGVDPIGVIMFSVITSALCLFL